MAEFTFFEVHLHDGFEFSPTNLSPLVGGRGDDDEEYEDYEAAFESEETDADESGGSRASPGVGLLVGLVLLVGIAAAVRYLRGDDEELDDLESLDADAEEVEIDA